MIAADGVFSVLGVSDPGRGVAGLKYMQGQLEMAREALLALQEGRPCGIIICRSCQHFVRQPDPKLRISDDGQWEHQCGAPQAGHFPTGVKT